MERVKQIAQQFAEPGETLTIQPHGSGNVNDTFLVHIDKGHPDKKYSDKEAADLQPSRFVLQRINTHVFQQPKLIMLNLRTFTDHVQRRLQTEAMKTTRKKRRWATPQILQTQSRNDYFTDDQGGFWRAISYIEGSSSHPTINSLTHASEAGYALGRFHSLISDLDIAQLHDTLEGFHITPQYLQNYDQILQNLSPTVPVWGMDHPFVTRCLQFVEKHRDFATILEEAKSAGKLITRPIHGDPKADNIMIDHHSGQAVSIVDLDTVKPGLVHYDIGDCLRSCCNRLGEESAQVDDVTFDIAYCEAILKGYLTSAQSFFTEYDYHYLFDSIRLIAFELGLRFFCDYLSGDLYFKAKYEAHNLIRAMVQFQLTESIEQQETEIHTIITNCIKR